MTPRPLQNESGVALLMTFFVLALATILITEIGTSARFDQRASRNFVEGIQSSYLLKSSLNLGRLAVEAPHLPGLPYDWLQEPWSLVATFETLPIQDSIPGNPEVRMTIVDEEGKLDVNSLSFGKDKDKPLNEWMEVFENLFVVLGFEREGFSEESGKTIGNIAYGPADQVAVIRDFIDRDNSPFKSELFQGKGIESAKTKNTFINRPFEHLNELLMVPGMTAERLALIAPFVRISQQAVSQKKVNLNTAPFAVLTAIGVPSSRASELVSDRQGRPILPEVKALLGKLDPRVDKFSSLTTKSFSIITRVKLPASTKWMRAVVRVRGSKQAGPGSTSIESLEFY